MPSTSVVSSYRSWTLPLMAAGAFLGATAAMAAGSVSDAQAVYAQDRAACNSGRTNQDRATCLQEAGAALRENGRGGLDQNKGQYEGNRLQRCEGQPAADRHDCLRRMSGEGTTSGSVESGGIYRELVTPVVPPQRN